MSDFEILRQIMVQLVQANKLMVRATQELVDQVEELERRVKALEDKPDPLRRIG